MSFKGFHCAKSFNSRIYNAIKINTTFSRNHYNHLLHILQKRNEEKKV